MSSIERPGINPKWLKKMKTWHKGKTSAAAALAHRAKNREELEYYVAHGICKTLSENPKEGRNDWRRDYYFEYECLYYAQGCLAEYESRATQGDPADAALARRCVTAYYLYELMNYAHDRDLVGGGGDVEGVLYAALALVLGCRHEGNILARQFVRVCGGEQINGGGYGLQHYSEYMSFAPDTYHAPHFMLRLLADYFGAPPLPAGHRGA